MKTIAIIILLFSGLCHAQQYAALDEKNGYKDLKFEMNESDFLKKVQVVKQPNKEVGVNVYKIQTASYLTIGDCKLSAVYVSFFKQKLIEIDMYATGSVSSSNLLSTLSAAFSEPFQPNQFKETYAWIGEKVTGLYEQNFATKNSKVSFSSVAMMELLTQFNAQRDSKNSKQF